MAGSGIFALNIMYSQIKNKNMSSLDSLHIWPFTYVLKCQPRTDLNPNLGSLPDHTLYVGSSMQIQHRICQHCAGQASKFTREFPPMSVEKVLINRRESAKETLKIEDDETIDCMYSMMQQYTHPDVWKCVAGGSWSKHDLRRPMPWPLRNRLQQQPIS